jgi:ElaB/YqjD/DUF883 family membrane-anchored ribosome-binding protein
MNSPNPADTLNTARRAGESILNKEAIENKVAEARELARSTYERSKDKAVEWSEGFEDYVRERPMKSLLVAVGLGIVLGAVMSRR